MFIVLPLHRMDADTIKSDLRKIGMIEGATDMAKSHN